MSGGMHRVLAWKRHLRAHVTGDDAVLLVGEGEQFLLRGRPYAQVAPLLDGSRTIEQILAALASAAPLPEIYFAIGNLEQRGYVAEVTPALGPGAAGFWHALGSDAGVVAARLAATPVEVHAAGDADPGLVREALVEAGLHVVAPPPDGDGDGGALRVLVTADYLAAPVAAFARAARTAPSYGRWLPVRTSGLSPWIGPLLGRADGPCWECLAHRLRWNRPVEVFLQRLAGADAPPAPPRVGLAASERAGASLAALTLAWWIADGGTGAIDDHLLALDLTDYRAVRHRVARRPQCPACGDSQLIARRAEAPVVLASRPRRRRDGGFRTVTPEDTVARCEALVSPITGVLASVGPMPGRDHPLRPVHGAVYRVVPAGADPHFDDFHRMSSGKGRTSAQARASAVCEGLERISAIFHGDEARVRAPLAALGGDALHPDALHNFSAAQMAQAIAARDRDAAAAGRDRKRRVPAPYDPERAIDWTPVWSLTEQRRRLLPTSYCYLGAPDGDDVCGFNPNGHASGNCLEEAILQGFLELVERDAIALWWYNRTRAPAVDLAGFGDDYFVALRDHYRELDWQPWLLDLTTDLGIPVFVALAEHAGTGRFTVGFGCHLDAGLAAQRALTELNQIFDPSLTGPAPWQRDQVIDPSFLEPDPAVAPRTAADYPAPPGDGDGAGDLRDDVAACVARAAASGLEVLVLDQTRPDLGLHAAKVVVPGLRHFWPRFGPGRLYDVPVALGRLARPRAESELNPLPLWL